MVEKYNHAEIEAAAQKKWEELDIYRCDLTDTAKEPYYLLFEFPYPSGDLHIGHWYAFAVTDIYARFKRMMGKNVLFPMGFDSFGLPAENAAIKNGANPEEWTNKNIERMRSQVRSIGSSVDWSKEIITSSPEYYKWTQWLFVKFFEHDLAYKSKALVNWDPVDMTVLANEQVLPDGTAERSGALVEKKELEQWFFRITAYADRLLEDLNALPWRNEIKEAQRSWIGKSEGSHITFSIEGSEEIIKVFTTRPDTIFGVTYVVLAPEHSLVETLLPSVKNVEEVKEYRAVTSRKSERDRSENKEKTGVRLEGVSAINPATKEAIPVYTADYVLNNYGTGAVMAVPAHDERDFEFAQKFNLPIKHVVIPRIVDVANPPVEGKPIVARHTILGIVHDSKTGKYLALKWKEQPWTTFITGGIDEGEDPVAAAKREIHEETGYKNIKLVRVLGGPIQSEFFAAHKDENRIAYGTDILFELENDECDAVSGEESKKHEAVWLDLEQIAAEKMRHGEIQVILDRMNKPDEAYTGNGVLFNSGEFSGRDAEEALWDVSAFVGGERTTNYRIRDWLVSRQRYWGCPIPIVYDPEGKAHAIPAEHLPWLLPTDVDFKPRGKAPLASSKELQDRVTAIFGEGWTPEYDTLDVFVDSSWYYMRYLDPKDEHDFTDQSLMKKWMPVDRYSGGSEHTTVHLLYARFFNKALYDLALSPVSEPFNERFNRGLIMGTDGQKMSKRWGNVVNPDEMVEKFGADAVRVYLAFIGPYNEPGSYPWNLDGVHSMRKFLDRVVRVGEKVSDTVPTEELTRALARAAHKAADDSDRFKFNTAVAALMTVLRDFEALPEAPKAAWQDFLKLLAPFAPHVTEYLWEQSSGEGSIHASAWPAYDAALLATETVEVTVQVNGKRRGTASLSAETSQEDALAAALEIPAVAAALGGKTPTRVVYVPGRILNLVVV